MPGTASTKICEQNLGLVCQTFSPLCRFRTITRTRYLSLADPQRGRTLLEIYWDNLGRLHGALSFCSRENIRLYRMPSGLFPMSDEAAGEGVLRAMAANLSAIGRRADRLKIRMVMHPDQFVVLNSESAAVVATSRRILEKHALAMNLMGLPKTTWSMLLIHCGKGGRASELVGEIRKLPANVRRRLALENDESSYGAAETLKICQQANVPMVFDCHHHAIHAGHDSYAHASFARFTKAAAKTWPRPDWQIVHVSNGATHFRDRAHSDYIETLPAAFASVPWVEVEAKAKELAIERMRGSHAIDGQS